MFLVQHPIPVAVSEQPELIVGLLTDLLQEVRQLISRAVHRPREAGGRAVGDDVVHRPSVGAQVPSGLGVFLCGGQLLRPPGAAPYPKVPLVLQEQVDVLAPEIWVVHVQDAVLNVVRGGSAHGEEGASF